MELTDFSIEHYDHDGDIITSFSPENLKFSLLKGENGPHTISYELSRSRASVGPDFIGPYRTSFRLYAQASTTPVFLLAGVHTSLEVESDQEMASVAGKGWLHVLERRFFPYEASGPNVHRIKFGGGSPTSDDPPTGFAYYLADEDGFAVGDIITELTAEVFDFSNEWGLSVNVASIGSDESTGPIYYTIDLIDTENILSKLTSLSQRDPGEFDFFMTEDSDDRVIHFVGPRRYSLDVVDDPEDADIQHIFDSENPQSGLISVKFTNTGPAATRLVGTGSSLAEGSVSTRQYNPGIDSYGMLESEINFPEANDADSIEKLTRKALLFGTNPVHEITITAAPELVTNFFAKMKPGKAIWLTANLEAHNIDSAQEIVQVDYDVDASGESIATITLNQIYAAVGLS